MIDLFYECGENDIAKYAYDTTPVFVVLTFPLSFLNHRVSQQKFLIGLVIIIGKSIQVNATYYLVLKVLKMYLLTECK